MITGDASNDDPKSADAGADGDLSDMLQELRILLQGSQLLSGFLTVLPFSEGFARIDAVEKWVYLATFVCAIVSLVLFSAPAAHHRIVRPIVDRVRFKDYCTRMILRGLVALSLALILSTQLVVDEVLGQTPSLVCAGLVAVLVISVWWVMPILRKSAIRGD